MIELEKTYLAKFIPNLEGCDFKEMIDIYIPKDDNHPCLRIRKNGDKYEITRKKPIEENKSIQTEDTIELTKEEYNDLSLVEGKKVKKLRYNYMFNGKVGEIDIFQDELKGLVLVDFEFESEEEMNKFEMPDFCLADVSQEVFIAGGMLCGKKYEDIENELAKFNYKKLIPPLRMTKRNC